MAAFAVGAQLATASFIIHYLGCQTNIALGLVRDGRSRSWPAWRFSRSFNAVARDFQAHFTSARVHEALKSSRRNKAI
jgi:hypothetical protein